LIRILIVDDHEDAADSLGKVLRLMGHNVEVAYSASAALARLDRFSPDLFLLDLKLPDMDGYELARRLRQVARKEAKFVAVSGYPPGIGGDLADNLFDGHVVKPMGPEVLLRVLRVWRGPDSRDNGTTDAS
jgi:CheY-like chemotaxis protein